MNQKKLPHPQKIHLFWMQSEFFYLFSLSAQQNVLQQVAAVVNTSTPVSVHLLAVGFILCCVRSFQCQGPSLILLNLSYLFCVKHRWLDPPLNRGDVLR